MTNKSNSENKINAVVWDIGGVLLEDPVISDFWGDAKGSKELRDLFGSGKVSKTDFIKKASELINISEKDFLKKYGSVYFPSKRIMGVLEILKKIKLRQFILSDTNPLHAGFIKLKFKEIFEPVEKLFLSHEIGSRKNEEITFKKLISELRLEPEAILFIDNKQEILSFAEKFGIKTLLYKNSESLYSDLKCLNVLK